MLKRNAFEQDVSNVPDLVVVQATRVVEINEPIDPQAMTDRTREVKVKVKVKVVIINSKMEEAPNGPMVVKNVSIK